MGIDLLRKPRCESLSSIRTYQDCPRAYYYKYIEKIKNPVKSSHFRLGSYVDYCLSYALKHNFQIPQELSDELPAVQWSDGLSVCEFDWPASQQIAKRVLLFIQQSGWTTLGNSACSIQADLISVTEEIRGIADWLARDPQGNLCIVDFKVSKTPPSPTACLDFDQQLGVYAHILRSHDCYEMIDNDTTGLPVTVYSGFALFFA